MAFPETSATTTTKTWKGSIRDWIFIPLIGSIIITLTYDWNVVVDHDLKSFIENVGISFAFWSTLANGNAWLIGLMDKRWTWLEAPIKRSIIGISGMLVFSLIDSIIIIFLYVELIKGLDFFKVVEAEGLMNALAFPLIITTIIALWGHGRSFLISWKQAAIDVERLKNENLESRFESLRSQVNPHFLFNSLNALSSLVYADQARAVDFIQKLSEVYRYVLEHQNDEVVELDSEMDFLKSFVFLNKIRFGDNFEVSYTNLDDCNGWSVPPVALQMLVENCIKHNEVSSENPLIIEISKTNDSIVIENNLNAIEVSKQDSNGLGLSNIISRYELLSDQKVEVEKSENSFRVSVPLLKFE